MIDAISLVYNLPEPPKQVVDKCNKPFEWYNLIWNPKFDKYGTPYAYNTKIKNLHITMTADRIKIENSIQKFYRNNNYEPFNFHQLKEAYNQLNDLLPFNLYEAKISSLEIGVAIEEDTSTVLSSWANFNGKQAAPMLSRNNQYGAKYFLTEYSVKGYDKTKEVAHHDQILLPQQLFRFEVAVKTKNLNRGKYGIGIYTVNDLIDPFKYQLLGNFLIEKYKQIEKVPVIELKNTTIKEKRLIATFKDTIILKSIKKQHPDSYKKDKIIHNKIIKKLNDNSFQTRIADKILEQVQKCYNNPLVKLVI